MSRCGTFQRAQTYNVFEIKIEFDVLEIDLNIYSHSINSQFTFIPLPVRSRLRNLNAFFWNVNLIDSKTPNWYIWSIPFRSFINFEFPENERNSITNSSIGDYVVWNRIIWTIRSPEDTTHLHLAKVREKVPPQRPAVDICQRRYSFLVELLLHCIAFIETENPANENEKKSESAVSVKEIFVDCHRSRCEN